MSVSFANDHADKGGSICLCEDVLISRAPRVGLSENEFAELSLEVQKLYGRNHYSDDRFLFNKSVTQKEL